MQDKYTPEQVKDISEREAIALNTLKDLQLTPSAVLHSVNLGNDVFGTKVTPYLQDIKYSKDPASSPAPEAVEAEVVQESVSVDESSDGAAA